MPTDDHQIATERAPRERWHDVDWECATDALDCLRAASLRAEEASAAIRATLALVSQAHMDLARAAEVAQGMVNTLRTQRRKKGGR